MFSSSRAWSCGTPLHGTSAAPLHGTSAALCQRSCTCTKELHGTSAAPRHGTSAAFLLNIALHRRRTSHNSKLDLQLIPESRAVSQECIRPRLVMWLNWFRRTQKSYGLFSFRWSGRQMTDGIWHTLSSGLDDYPRSNMTSTLRDRHLDLM